MRPANNAPSRAGQLEGNPRLALAALAAAPEQPEDFVADYVAWLDDVLNQLQTDD